MQKILWRSSKSGDDKDTKSVTNDNNLVFDGWINIYDSGGFIQSGSGIYETEDKALEAGKIIKGYITSVSISFPSTLIKTIGKS